jgi:hypothetical protein
MSEDFDAEPVTSIEEIKARMEQARGHTYAPGCCTRPWHEHELTAEEIRERREWLDTEPGKGEQLAYFRAALEREELLGVMPPGVMGFFRDTVARLEGELGD